MAKAIVVDTNLLLDDPKILFKLAVDKKIIIPLTVLKELDKHKFNPNLSYSARSAIHELVNFKKQFPDKIIFSIDNVELSSNDDLIISAAINNDADIATKDLSMSVIAGSRGVNADLYDVVKNGLFDPYIEIEIKDLPDDFPYVQEYKQDILKVFEDITKKSYSLDAWLFIFIKQEGRDKYLLASNPVLGIVERIDNLPDYRNVIVDGIKIKALDWYQICAFYAFKEADCVLITGKWGSGKTLLATASTLEKSDNKVFISRPPIGINHKYDIGWLPGSKEDKLMDWMAGFVSALYYIYSNTRGQISNKDKEKTIHYDFVKEKIFRDKFEVVPINSVQGMSLLKDDYMIIDECQLIDIDYLSMILSRVGDGSKLILLGDLGQSYGVIRPSESGLLKLLRALPHKSMAYVNLKTSYRSDIIELADRLQDKSII